MKLQDFFELDAWTWLDHELDWYSREILVPQHWLPEHDLLVFKLLPRSLEPTSSLERTFWGSQNPFRNRERSKKVYITSFHRITFRNRKPFLKPKTIRKNWCLDWKMVFWENHLKKTSFFSFQRVPPPSFQLRPTNPYLSKIPIFPSVRIRQKNGSPKSPESRRRNIRKISRGKIRAVVCWPAGWFNRVRTGLRFFERGKCGEKKAADRVRVFFHAGIVRRTLGASDSDVQIWPSDIGNVFCLGGIVIESRKKTLQ